MQPSMTPMEKNQTFCFACDPGVSCFNACCRDLTQALMPYDVLRLARHLQIASGEFLAAYTQTSTGPGSGLPVVSLRFGDADDLACPFVTPKGCSVYPARPASCRTYPLARGLARDRATGRLTEQWALIRENHCQGFGRGRQMRVHEWIADQQITVYNQMNDRLLALIHLKNSCHPGVLPPSLARQITTALYDLDRFRQQLAELPIDADEARLQAAAEDDEALLAVAMAWAAQLLTDPSPKGATP